MRLCAAALISVLGVGALPAHAQDGGGLEGAWVVDLSAKPDQPYTQPMQLTLNADKTVSGTFYQSTIEAGRWRTDRGRTCASFRTTDGAGPYHTAACITGDRVEGQTWAEHRDFVFVWNASRAP